MEIKGTNLSKDSNLAELHSLLKEDKVYTGKINEVRPTAYQFSSSLVGVIAGAGILLSGKAIVATLVFILTAPVSLMFSGHRFSQKQFLDSLNPLISLIKGSSPAIKYLEGMAKRRKMSAAIKKQLGSVSEIKQDDLKVLLEDTSRDSLKVLIMSHYYKHLKH